MGYRIEDLYDNTVDSGLAETVELHRITTVGYPSAAFTVEWKVTAQTVIEDVTYGIFGKLQGAFQRAASGDLVPIPANASPIMIYLVGTAPMFDADAGEGIALTGAIDGTTLVLSAVCPDGESTHWVSQAVVEGNG